MKFLGTKKDGLLVHPLAIKEKKRRYWKKVPEGAIVESSLTVKRRDKTQSQLGMIWGLMMAKAVIMLHDAAIDTSYLYKLDKPTGNPIKERPLCDYLYEVCPIINEDGEKITLRYADTKQASEFFEEARNQLASEFGVNIPDPNKMWKELEAKRPEK